MKVVTFGEIMLRLEPEGFYRFIQADRMISSFGGAEANVAVSLAQFGAESIYLTKLPSHEIGQSAFNVLRRYGVETSFIVRGGSRLGIYFNERGASQRSSKCIYDRAGSSFAENDWSEYDFESAFSGADWFHLTGITPALSEKMPSVCENACRLAKEKGLTVSLDLNYRSKLWSQEDAKAAIERLTPYVDVCICNEEDAFKVFGIKAEGSDVNKGKLNLASYKKVAKNLFQKYGFKKVALTLRSSINASQNKWCGLLYDGKKYYVSREYEMMIVDRVGGGDSFTAGLIWSLLNKKNLKDCVEFASAAAVLKHSVEGDFNAVSEEEVLSLAGGNGSGRILR